MFNFTKYSRLTSKIGSKSAFNRILETKTKSGIHSFGRKSFFSGNFTIVPKIIKYSVFTSFGIYIVGIGMMEPQYIQTFLYNKTQFVNGNVTNVITSHFTKLSLLDLVIDSVITVGIGSSIGMMIGEMAINRLVLSSVGISSLILLLLHNDGVFYKSEAVLRGLIYYLVFTNPYTSFTLLPFPITIKAVYIGSFLAVIDIISKKHCNFGGAIAAYLLLKR